MYESLREGFLQRISTRDIARQHPGGRSCQWQLRGLQSRITKPSGFAASTGPIQMIRHWQDAPSHSDSWEFTIRRPQRCNMRTRNGWRKRPAGYCTWLPPHFTTNLTSLSGVALRKLLAGRGSLPSGRPGDNMTREQILGDLEPPRKRCGKYKRRCTSNLSGLFSAM